MSFSIALAMGIAIVIEVVLAMGIDLATRLCSSLSLLLGMTLLKEW
jgi:hypothetical protein